MFSHGPAIFRPTGGSLTLTAKAFLKDLAGFGALFMAGYLWLIIG